MRRANGDLDVRSLVDAASALVLAGPLDRGVACGADRRGHVERAVVAVQRRDRPGLREAVGRRPDHAVHRRDVPIAGDLGGRLPRRDDLARGVRGCRELDVGIRGGNRRGRGGRDHPRGRPASSSRVPGRHVDGLHCRRRDIPHRERVPGRIDRDGVAVGRRLGREGHGRGTPRAARNTFGDAERERPRHDLAEGGDAIAGTVDSDARSHRAEPRITLIHGDGRRPRRRTGRDRPASTRKLTASAMRSDPARGLHIPCAHPPRSTLHDQPETRGPAHRTRPRLRVASSDA